MKLISRGTWQFVDKKEGEMTQKPGASTVWKTTEAGLRAIGIERE